MKVLPIKNSDAYPWLLEKHYARRICPISHAFGLFIDGVLNGVVTYGVPVSSSLRSGVCGDEWEGNVLELNRLCCNSVRNAASYLVGNSLKLLPKPSVIVSYADIAQGHVGYIYQATNFIYTGLSAKRTDWMIRGMEHKHGATIADESRGKDNRAEYMRKKYGDRFYLKERPRKHRYICFCGNKRDKRFMRQALLYTEDVYPKGTSKRYDAGGVVPVQDVMFI